MTGHCSNLRQIIEKIVKLLTKIKYRIMLEGEKRWVRRNWQWRLMCVLEAPVI